MNDHNELIERCKEICAWQDTGLLKGDALRNFAKSRPYCNQINSVSMAEAETLREVADAFIASVDRIAELESSLAATSDMVNKAFADGKAEGHGDATAEASVVIGELRARVAELEAERAEREKQEPVAWVHFPNKKPSIKTLSFSAEPTPQQKAVGFVSRPLYATPPVTAPVRLTDRDKDGLAVPYSGMGGIEDYRAYAQDIETAVLRANGFKVEE